MTPTVAALAAAYTHDAPYTDVGRIGAALDALAPAVADLLALLGYPTGPLPAEADDVAEMLAAAGYAVPWGEVAK